MTRDQARDVALAFPCPHCPAGKGRWCLTPMGQPYRQGGRGYVPVLHSARVELARKAILKAQR